MSGGVLFRLLAWSVALVLLALPVVGLLNGSFAADQWPLRRVELVGEHRQVPPAQVQAVVATFAGDGFFALSLAELRAALAQLPWVESVEVRKRWPDTLAVRLLEHQPYAVWSSDRLVSRAGHLFAVPGIERLDGLPRLSGPDGEVATVVNFHARAARELAATGQDVVALDLSPRGSWTLRLASGIEVTLGRDQAEARLARFADTLATLLAAEPARRLAHADLRYPNGFALTWQDVAELPPVAGAAADGAAPSSSTAAPSPSRRTPTDEEQRT